MKLKTGSIFMEGQVDFDVYLPMLREWFDVEFKEILEREPFCPDKAAIVMGLPLWGKTFIDRFFSFCVPTLLSGGNISALRGACRLILFTSQDDLQDLIERVKLVENYGIEVEIYVIPDTIMQVTPQKPYNKYWLLGTVQQLCVQIARRSGMGFHMLMPDHVYADGYFTNLFRLAEEHDAICQTTISGDIEPCVKALEAHREGDAITVTGNELGAIIWNNMHKQNYPLVMNSRDLLKTMPDSHFYLWVGQDRLHIYCPHMNVAYLSPRAVYCAPVMLHNALDTQLVHYMPHDVYMPTLEDALIFSELSDETKGEPLGNVTLNEWMLRVWCTVHFRKEYMRFMAMKNEFPIPRQYDFVPAGKIDELQAGLMSALLGNHESLKDWHETVAPEIYNTNKEAA